MWCCSNVKVITVICDDCKGSRHDTCDDLAHPYREYNSCFCQHREVRRVERPLEASSAETSKVYSYLLPLSAG